MKRLIAILLAVVLSIGLLPSFAAAQGGGNDETPYELRHPKAIEVWKTIERAETEAVAENTHEVWSQSRLSEGWTYGPRRDDAKLKHPCLIPYADLPEVEKDYDRRTAMNAIKLIVKLGYRIEKADDGLISPSRDK